MTLMHHQTRGNGGPGGGMGGDFTPENAPEGAREMKVEKAKTTDDEETDYAAIDDISRKATSSGVSISGTYETAQDYIDALNKNGTWVSYDEATNTATITSIADFTAAVKTVSKELGAFDQLDESQGENTLFGYGDGVGAHFDTALAEILEEMDYDYADDYAEDLTNTEINLALALENYSADIDVEFTTVWGMGHTEAERSGDSTSHFINWVNECLASQS